MIYLYRYMIGDTLCGGCVLALNERVAKEKIRLHYAKEYGESFNNIAKDPKKYSELAGQSKKRVEEMEKIKSNLNRRQAEEYQTYLEIVLKVNRGGK